MGIVPAYHDVTGQEHRVDEKAALSLLGAMGLDAATEEAAEAAVREMEAANGELIVPPAVVVAVEEGAMPLLRFRVPRSLSLPVRWQVEVTVETGERLATGGTTDERDVAAAVHGVPHGYHRARVTLSGASGQRSAETALIVAPTRCWTPADAVGDHRAFGVWTNLYSVRTDYDWGVGDFGDLRRLIAYAAERGAAFVGVNPLHALRNRGSEISPYSPVSRLFRSPVYISVTDVPELAESDSGRVLLASDAVQGELAALRDASLIEYERVRRLKERVLRVLFDHFVARHRGSASARGRAFAEYVAREGEPLELFATFLALESHLAVDDVPQFWREWPEQYRTPRSPAVGRFREEYALEIDWHRWVQFELDRQLGQAAEAARDAGMPIGLYQDLAVGTSEGGSDVWAFQHLFDRGVTVGAPPDDYSKDGQDWGLPPLDPNRLRSDGYSYWIGLLRAGFRHAGALRIDHAMGLVRLYWIPPGLPATEGAYVRYPAEDLLAILALESRRHRAVVIAEDLGTVPEGFDALLEQWGILSSSVLWFEREDGGGFKPAAAYRSRALVTTTTHDHAPLAAWLTGRDTQLRHAIGVIDETQARDARSWRQREREALVARLRESGVLEHEPAEPTYAAMLAAVYSFIAATRARLVGVSLDDLAGESEPVNIPGVAPDRYPAWSRRMGMPLEDLTGEESASDALAAVRLRIEASDAG